MSKLIATGEGSLIKLEGSKRAHYLPTSITENPNFPFKSREKNVIELYEDHIVIRLKGDED